MALCHNRSESLNGDDVSCGRVRLRSWETIRAPSVDFMLSVELANGGKARDARTCS